MRSTPVTPVGLVTVEHELAVPLDHAQPDGEQLTVFAREVADPEGRDKPFLVFLQGGPGCEAPRPTRDPSRPAWLERALHDFRVLMVDQRGTGRSTPVGPGSDPTHPTAQEQAGRLAHFRADAIVRDCELLRKALGSPPWSVLGQSFGGLTAVSYLSLAPEGLREVLITGGVPPVGRPVDDLYGVTYPLIERLAARHFARYPGDADRVRALHARIERDGPIPLAGGARLTARGVRALGHGLGMSDGSAALHHLLELPVESPVFGQDAADAMGFARHPLYALVHEACWADGGVTDWSAARLEPDDPDPLRLTGEHVFPDALDELPDFAPLRAAADLLAAREWPRLYDDDVLAANTVPVAAVVYLDDPYVPHVLSMETATRVRNMRTWETSEYLHNGLRADGDRILGRLLDMARERL